VPELDGEIYPTNAPKTASKPFLVYTKHGSNKIKTLDGFVNTGINNYIFNIIAKRYETMKSLTQRVDDLLKTLAQRTIGENGIKFVDDIEIHNISETHEHELHGGVERGIIDFTIYYRGRYAFNEENNFV
jgi:hypothetical protein